jgi:5,10-methylenetetrahydromethanopterin reductase
MALQSGFRVCVRVPATHPARDVVATVQRAERHGFSGAWLPDSHLNYREVWSTLGAVAVSTETIEIGPTVTNLVSRHPTVTAAAARTVAEAAPGRVILGLGSGDSAIGFDDMRPSAAAVVADGVVTLRTLMAGDPIQYGTFSASLRGARSAVPIYVAASGPRLLAGVGRVADAGIVTPGRLREKLDQVAAGAREVSRPTPPVYVYAMCAVTNDIEQTSRLLKPVALRLAQLEGVGVFAAAGVRIDVPKHTAGAEGDVGHAADFAQAARELDGMVSDEAALWVARNRAIVGTEAEVIDRLRTLRKQGAAGVAISQISGNQLPDDLIEAVGPLLGQVSI